MTSTALVPLTDVSYLNPLDSPLLYRIEATITHGSFDLDGDYIGDFGNAVPSFTCYVFRILKRTPQGAWITDLYGRRRWINFAARKRYACSTQHEAMVSFIARKERQVKILKARLDDTEIALWAAKNSNPKPRLANTETWVTFRVEGSNLP